MQKGFVVIKTFKSTIALLLAVILVLSLAACSSGNPIAGTWKYHLNFKDVIEKQVDAATDESEKAMYEKMIGSLEGVTIDFFFEFDQENKFKIYADDASVEQAVEKIKECITSLIPDLFAALGVSKDNIDQYLKSYGVSMDELADSYLKDMDTESIKNISLSGTYKAENGKLYIAESDKEIDENEYISYEISNDTLSFTDIPDSVEKLSTFKEWGLPVQLEKVK